jgi:ubiquinone/menaquinone biosynthesis C-methylase UbiE
MAVLSFYGATNPAMFALERDAMDRPGLVIQTLHRRLPKGLILDVGAGNGHTAVALTSQDRTIVPLEPAVGMLDRTRPLPWVRGDAAHLPFGADTFDGAYATWAYFFSRTWDPSPGLAELHRVVRSGGPLLIADNLGGDEFSALASTDISADGDFWSDRGFDCEEVETRFAFKNLDEARTLLGFYFGEAGRDRARVELSYRVGVFYGASC